MTKLNSGTREGLKNVSTATICTALFKRGLRNQFIQDVRPLKAKRDNMVGEAFTLRYIPARGGVLKWNRHWIATVLAGAALGIAARCSWS